jgi:hypothetical protein
LVQNATIPIRSTKIQTETNAYPLNPQEMIAINQQSTPQGRPVKDGDMTVWARQMEDGSVAVALYNEDDKEIQVCHLSVGSYWQLCTMRTRKEPWHGCS